MTLTLGFQGQSLKWWGGQMYQIVTGVTSDVGVLLTYLVFQQNKAWTESNMEINFN